MIEIVALFVLAVWVYLLAARGGFWLGRERDDRAEAAAAAWPAVVAVIPARDEAATIGRTVQSLLTQDYPGLEIMLVDDGSTDGTAAAAEQAAPAGGLTVIKGEPLPAGWTGKVWAQKQGVAAALAKSSRQQSPRYVLLTDADIVYAPGALARLVARAEHGHYALTSLMVKLRCDSLAERAFIPAFVFFFQMLYPFSWVGRSDHATAAAAGGCMLARTDILEESGGLDRIRDALIDDCALARQLKAEGPIWLGLTESVRSIRAYDCLGPIRRMVVRSAYAQLDYSPLQLAGTLLGMALTFLAAPLLALFATGSAALMGAAAWLMMAIAFQPTLRLYGLNPLWGLALPLIAFVYTIWTIESALQYLRGQGGQWKGRVQASPKSAPRGAQ
jgi:hopene-associated glycosyltransferase HpnB